jgi:hypothetical protein
MLDSEICSLKIGVSVVRYAAGHLWPLPSLRSGRLTRGIPAARPAGPLATLVCPNRLSCRFVALQICFLQICLPLATNVFKDLRRFQAF